MDFLFQQTSKTSSQKLRSQGAAYQTTACCLSSKEFKIVTRWALKNAMYVHQGEHDVGQQLEKWFFGYILMIWK